MTAENDLPDEDIRRMWAEGTPVELAPGPSWTWNWSVLPDPIPQFRCEHMTASGLRLRSVACGICGPLWRAPA